MSAPHSPSGSLVQKFRQWLQGFLSPGASTRVPGRIDALSPEQQAQLEVYRDKWMAIGLLAGETDRQAAEFAIDDVYRCMDFPVPRLKLWVRNPLEGCIASYLVQQVCRSSGPDSWETRWGQVREATTQTLGAWPEVWQQVWLSLNEQVLAQAGPTGFLAPDDHVWEVVEGSVWAGIKQRLKVRLWADEEAHANPYIAPEVVGLVKKRVSSPLGAVVRDQLVELTALEIKLLLEAQFPSLEKPTPVSDVPQEETEELPQEPPKPSAPVVEQLMKVSSGAHKVYNLAFYSYLHEVCGLDSQVLSGVWGAATHCGWYWRYLGLVIMTPKPLHISLEESRLHRSDGPAVQYPGGFEIYARHGVRLPERMGLVGETSWQPDWFLSEEDMAVKRLLLSQIGFEPLSHALGASLLASEEDALYTYRLWRLGGEAAENAVPVLARYRASQPEVLQEASPLPAYIDTLKAARIWCEWDG